MNIYKKAKLRNLTNGELYSLLNKAEWKDKDLLREYSERIQKAKNTNEHELFMLTNFFVNKT